MRRKRLRARNETQKRQQFHRLLPSFFAEPCKSFLIFWATLPLEFYDENNPGRIAARVAKGLSNFTWTYPGLVAMLIPKAMRIVGVFVVIGLIDWRIAALVLVSVSGVLLYSLLGLKEISAKEEKLEK